MTPESNEFIQIELTVRAEQSELLQGLDLWLQLGLITDAQVRRICQSRLVCALPIAATDDFITAPTLDRGAEVQSHSPLASTDAKFRVSTHSPLISRLLSSLMAEISVVWLLFLGVFMVVVSSGVLAATQWQNFSPVGQYAILFSYTLAFWVASLWTRRQQNLSLTSRMLQIATLLIIPVNFWTIDGFNLWRSGSGWVLSAIAAISLCAIALNLLQSIPRLLLLNSLALSWLQWGWGLPGYPLIATYIGTVGTAILIFHRFEVRGEREALGNGSIAIAFSTLLLIARAALQASVPLDRLSLAIGICGWLLCWLTRRQAQPPLTQAGVGLLILGWLVAVTADPPWQAIAVSGLGIWLLADRFKRLWQFQDLLALFLLGLQAYCLLWWLIPVAGRHHIIALAIQLAGGNLLPGELIGLAIFPYVVVTLALASGLRWQQPILAKYAERLAFVLGILLALISLFHPLVRSLYLLVSTLTLAVVLIKRSEPGAWLIYLTHFTGLLALFSWIGWSFPNLNTQTWATILLVGMVAEWSLNLVATDSIWRRSGWHLGLALASLSYALLISVRQPNNYWGLIWLITPCFLTWLANRPNFERSLLASWLSITALLLAQILTVGGVTPLLISLGVATALMLVNTQQLQSLIAAVLTVGFGLGFYVTCLWRWGYVSVNWLPTWLAIALWGLWLLRRWIIHRHTRLSEIYASAVNGWAIALSILNLSILTVYVFYASLPIQPSPDATKIVLAAVLSTGAITYRLWQQPTNLGFYGIAWGVELAVAGVVLQTGASLTDLAIANLALGLVTQLSGDLWVRRSSSLYLSSWHAIPMIYAALGLIVAHNKFTTITGLYTLAAALTGVGVARRQTYLKPLSFLSIFGISFAAYELLVYQLLQASGGKLGDGIVLLAMLAAAIAISYRFLSRWLLSYLRLSPQELLLIAHFHWAGGSLLLLLALWGSLSYTGSNIWIGVTALVATYAIWQGRTNEKWIYIGVFEALAALSYLLYRTLPASSLVSWGGAIACLVAYTLYTLPWRAWGWSSEPWQQSAAIVPAAIVLVTFWGTAIQSLWIVAGFYAWLARVENRIRLSYLSIFLADWAILRLLVEWGISAPLWYTSVLSGSLLYVAQVEPNLRSPLEKEKRHILRMLATGLFCLTALYQSDPSLWQGLLTLAFSFGLILAGLTLRIRAFLYVGTATFIIKVLRQLWLFINNYSLLLWALGIVIGLIFIWIAATFESRRSQAIALVQYWIRELESWE